MTMMMKLSIVVTISYYHSRTALEFDLQQITSNCREYNDSGSELVAQAEQLQQVVMQIIDECFTERETMGETVSNEVSFPTLPFPSSTASQSSQHESVDTPEQNISLPPPFIQSALSWLQEQVQVHQLTPPSSLPCYLINHADAINTCQRPLLLPALLEKQAMQYYQSATEVFADGMLCLKTWKVMDCAWEKMEEEWKEYIQRLAVEYQVEVDM